WFGDDPGAYRVANSRRHLFARTVRIDDGDTRGLGRRTREIRRAHALEELALLLLEAIGLAARAIARIGTLERQLQRRIQQQRQIRTQRAEHRLLQLRDHCGVEAAAAA